MSILSANIDGKVITPNYIPIPPKITDSLAYADPKTHTLGFDYPAIRERKIKHQQKHERIKQEKHSLEEQFAHL